MSVRDHVWQLLRQGVELSIKEIVDKLGVSKQMVHRVVNQLVEEGLVERLGRPPRTIYRITQGDKAVIEPGYNPDELTSNWLQEEFMLITETGQILDGWPAFVHWCNQRQLPFEKTLTEFRTTKRKYEVFYRNGIIDGTQKLLTTEGFEKIWLDQLFYLDFYAIERFGKTRLGTLLHYAKQGQNKYLMSLIINTVKQKVIQFIKDHQVSVVGFVPPTIRREVQFMKYMQVHLNISLPHLELRKVSGIIPVPQKSLSKIDERIRNADKTFAITDTRQFDHVLLLDDAVGSGATLNQIAAKIKEKKIANRVTGLAIVGSFKGFDVITDV
jgi:predicted transcriptional regulator